MDTNTCHERKLNEELKSARRENSTESQESQSVRRENSSQFVVRTQREKFARREKGSVQATGVLHALEAWLVEEGLLHQNQRLNGHQHLPREDTQRGKSVSSS